MIIFWMAGTWYFEIWDFGKCPGPIFQKPATNGVLKNPILPGSKISLLAIYEIISHIWEDAPWKVNNDKPDLRFFHGNFWPVISQTVRKPCFSTSIPRGPNLCILGPLTWAHPRGRSLGPLTWARLGPTHLGPAWAHPRGPSLGPPTWAQTPAPPAPAPPAQPPDEFSNPDPGPSQRTQGWNASARKPRCWCVGALGSVEDLWTRSVQYLELDTCLECWVIWNKNTN